MENTKSQSGEREELEKLLDCFDKIICESQRIYLDHGDSEDIPRDIDEARNKIINYVEEKLSESKKEAYTDIRYIVDSMEEIAFEDEEVQKLHDVVEIIDEKISSLVG